jgi:hypothetical protein
MTATSIPYNEILLDRVKLTGQTALSSEMLSKMELGSYMDYLADRLVLQLQTEVLSHKVADSTYTMRVPIPSSPWQHFKYKHRERWWMRLLIKRSPIDYTNKEGVVTLSKAHRFPESTLRYPDHLGKVVIVEQGDLSYV